MNRKTSFYVTVMWHHSQSNTSYENSSLILKKNGYCFKKILHWYYILLMTLVSFWNCIIFVAVGPRRVFLHRCLVFAGSDLYCGIFYVVFYILCLSESATMQLGNDVSHTGCGSLPIGWTLQGIWWKVSSILNRVIALGLDVDWKKVLIAWIFLVLRDT